MAEVTQDDLDGYFKDVQADLEHAVPMWAHLQKRIPFREQDRLGDNYQFPIFLRRSHGVTMAGGSNAGTAFDLNDPVPLLSKEASLSGSEFVIQEDIPYGVLSRARKRGKEAYGDAMDEIVFGLRESSQFYLEMCMLYGGHHIGAVESITSVGAGEEDIVITLASWAPGIFAQLEGAKIDIYNAAKSTQRTNAAAAVITAIDPDTRTLTVTGDSGDLGDVIATDVILPYGFHTNWFDGMYKILSNTGSLFGIDAATYSLWRSNHKALTNKLTFGKSMATITKAVVRGLMKDVVYITNTYNWVDVMNDMQALKRFAGETKTEMKLGTNDVTFFGPNGGKLEFLPHPMMQLEHGFLVCPEHWRRPGSSDVSSRMPGVEGQQGNFYQELQSKAGIRIRGYWDQAMVCKKPAQQAYNDGLVPEAAA